MSANRPPSRVVVAVHARREVPADRLLVCGADVGWPALCGFLEVPVPDEPYPHLNDPAGFWGRVEARMAEARTAAAADR